MMHEAYKFFFVLCIYVWNAFIFNWKTIIDQNRRNEHSTEHHVREKQKIYFNQNKKRPDTFLKPLEYEQVYICWVFVCLIKK